MPWLPEVFSAPALQQVLDQRRREELVSVPYFDGLLAGEPEALLESFAGEPELHDPVRGRIKGAQAFLAFVAQTREWLTQHDAAVEDVERVILAARGFEEVVVHLGDADGRVDLPFAIITDHPSGEVIEELRLYYSGRPLTGHHANRPPLLQPDPALHIPDIVAEHQRALGAGDVDAIVATFEPDGYAREPAGAEHRGAEALRAHYERIFADGGGIALEHCTFADDGTACALEFNVVGWGSTPLPPQAGVAVYVRGASGKLAAARVYHDAEPPGCETARAHAAR